MRVLIVDDEPGIRKTTRMAVAAAGHEGVEAPNRTRALALLGEEAFDACFLDLKLGADDGLAVLEKLLHAQPNLAVVMFTAYATVATAVEALEGSGIPVAAVSTGFPAGLSPFKQRVEEIHESVKAGAQEIDIVITRRHVLTGDWQALYDEVQAFREACGDAHLKAILATGELATLTNVARASWVAMQAGADFIKTSTGKEGTNATLPFSLVMVRQIREYQRATGYKVGYKPAGGIRTAKQALEYLMLMKEELGNRWLEPDLFRFGASSLLTDIERQLEHHVTGRYAAAHRHPMP